MVPEQSIRQVEAGRLAGSLVEQVRLFVLFVAGEAERVGGVAAFVAFLAPGVVGVAGGDDAVLAQQRHRAGEGVEQVELRRLAGRLEAQ